MGIGPAIAQLNKMLFIYICGIFFFQIALAWRAEETRIRDVMWISYFWPIAFVFTIIIFWLDSIDWQVNCVKTETNKIFGFRKPDDNWPGIAIIIFRYELQFWKYRR